MEVIKVRVACDDFPTVIALVHPRHHDAPMTIAYPSTGSHAPYQAKTTDQNAHHSSSQVLPTEFMN